MKNNILTYAYRGIASVFYFITGHKEKIQMIFNEDNNSPKEIKETDVFNKKRVNVSQEKPDTTISKIGFRYKAKDKYGKIVKGTFDANSIEQAKKFLLNEGFEIIEIKARSKYDVDLVIGNPLSISELSFALTQLSTYIRAGIPLVDSVRILSRQTVKPSIRKVYDMVVYDLLAGDNFSTALSRQSKIFPKLLVNMTRSAELTGDLPNVLDEMAEYYSSMDKTRKEIKSAMTYPTVVFIFSIIVVAFVLIWVVPQYQSMFSGYGVDLPKITQLTLSLSSFLQHNAIVIIICIIVFLLIYLYLFRNVKSFRFTMQTFYLHVPVLKNIIMYSEVAMFTRTFASLLNHGVYITDSMDVLLNVSENEVYRKIIEKTIDNLNSGGKISDAFKGHYAFPIVAYEMIITGENTGKLGTMMDKVAKYYDNLHTNAVASIKSLIEPILIVFLAGSIGVIILSIILPMFEMYQVMI